LRIPKALFLAILAASVSTASLLVPASAYMRFKKNDFPDGMMGVSVTVVVVPTRRQISVLDVRKNTS
jgi:hypothetical protein